MKNISAICLCFCLICQQSLAQVKLADFETTPKTTYPVSQYEEGHIVEKCSSERTKRRAHMFSASNFNKTLDVEMQSRCYNTCELLEQLVVLGNVMTNKENSVRVVLKPAMDY